MTDKHHVVIGAWWQGRGKGDPYIRMFEVRCDPCRWRSKHTDQQTLANTWAADHQGIERDHPDWVRGPRTGDAE